MIESIVTDHGFKISRALAEIWACREKSVEWIDGKLAVWFDAMAAW